MKAIIYNLENRKLNNDLKEFLKSKRYNYYKDYTSGVRIITYFEYNFVFDYKEFKNFVLNKRKNETLTYDIINGIINW